MIAVLLGILAAVTLGAPFGEASAEAVEDGSYVAVTVTVAVDPGYAAEYTVVHVLNPDGQETFSLGEASPGVHAGTFAIQPFNRALVFEVGKAGESQLSETVSLVDLGVDVDLLQTTFTPSGSTTTDTRRWGWLALGTAALAAAAALTWWAWPRSSVTEPLLDKSGDATVVVDE
ncbi:MAG: hypothetical protein HKN80_04085 [Acidimicrobiia bacterium]|nr:hypothetical protein [Acidimicrobiia bacterium]